MCNLQGALQSIWIFIYQNFKISHRCFLEIFNIKRILSRLFLRFDLAMPEFCNNRVILTANYVRYRSRFFSKFLRLPLLVGIYYSRSVHISVYHCQLYICSNSPDMTGRHPISNVSSRSPDSLEILPILQKSPINSLIFNSLIWLFVFPFLLLCRFDLEWFDQTKVTTAE